MPDYILTKEYWGGSYWGNNYWGAIPIPITITIIVITPDCRILVIGEDPENREFKVLSENRTLEVKKC